MYLLDIMVMAIMIRMAIDDCNNAEESNGKVKYGLHVIFVVGL